ncbi:MAG: monovalent cation/H+ antiporter subunit D family protein [Rhodospirillales bacterium]|nr:monovalent cation/H+ antiporter subunit D family protein [Rhodospirillales bacterium]
MTPVALMELAVVLPLVGAILIAAAGRNPNLREAVTLLTAVLLLAVVVGIVSAVLEGERPEVALIGFLPGVTIALSAEPLACVFAVVASLLWIVTSVYSIGYMRAHHEENQTRFYAFFAIAIAAAMGVAFSANLVTLFVFYEALTLSTFPLVGHAGTAEARNGARTYAGLLLAASFALMLPAIIATNQAAGTVTFAPGGILAGNISDSGAAIILALFVFGIAKAALMPLHRWLPAAMVAPTPVSALLHAVAVVKAGVFCILKVTLYIFGLDFLGDTGISVWLTYVAAATILIGSLIALTKDNLKARLAYSTVSQLSYIVLGAMLATGAGIIGGAMHIAMHAFGKITLFFCAGAILVASHKTEISDMHGLGRRMPFTFAAFLLASLSIIGLPPTGGSWSKWMLMLATADTGQLLLMGALMLSSLLSIAYLLPVAVVGFMAPAKSGDPGHDGTAAGIREAPLLCVAPLWLTAIGTLALFFFAEPIFAFLEPLVK